MLVDAALPGEPEKTLGYRCGCGDYRHRVKKKPFTRGIEWAALPKSFVERGGGTEQ